MSSRPLLANRDPEDDENDVGNATQDDLGDQANRFFLEPGKFTALEKLMFFVSAVLLVLMCVFAGLYAKSRYRPDHIDHPGDGNTNSTDPPPNKTVNVCFTRDCVITAAKVIQDIDLTVDPCDDFYAYTCGGWLESHFIPNEKSSVNVFSEIDDTNKKALRQIIEGNWHIPKTPQNVSTDLPDPDEIVDRQNFVKLKNFYNSCLNETHIDELGAEPLLPIIREITKIFPATLLSDEASVPTVQLQSQPWSANLTHTLALLAKYNINPLFSFYVGADAKDPDLNALYLTQSGLGLPSKEYYLEEDVLEVYESVVRDTLKLVLGEKIDTFMDVEGDQPASSAFDRVEFVARRIVDFEQKLAKISKTSEELSDPEKTYNLLSIPTLKQKSPNIAWHKFLEDMVPPHKDLPTAVIVEAPDYISLLSTSLLATSAPNTLQYYIIWQTVLALVPELGYEYRQPLQRLKAKLTGVDPKIVSPRWETCLRKVDDGLGQLEGRFYVLSRFAGDTKERADEFIASIKDAFVERLPELNWIDDETREKAIEKVDTLAQKVGYPTSSPNILSPVSLAEYYESLTVLADDHFGNQLSADKWAANQMWKKLGTRVDREQWFMNPQTVNAYYNPTTNEIAFPAGILQPPFFGSANPEYLNYGGIGVIVGHELTHGFDNNGRQYDARGKLTQWWSNDTVKNFESRAQCFIDQYSNFTVPNPNGDEKVHVNGRLTLGENLADNGGLRESYMAWRKRFDEDVEEEKLNNVVLPGLEDLSREKLFFINFGRSWCNKIRPESSLERIRTDPHSPARWRVNGAIQNSRLFAETFNCPVGSAMNPENKCELW